MALKSVPGIDLESLPEEARSLIAGTRAEGAGCRPPRTRESAAEMLRLERLKKYGPKSEKLSAGQIELLELEPRVHAQEVEKDPRSLRGESASRSASMPGATPCPSICHGARRSLPWRARRGSACAAERSAAALAARDRAGPLLCARDQARETGLPQMPGESLR